MNPRWLALPSLLLLVGCPALDPAQAYREAARRLALAPLHASGACLPMRRAWLPGGLLA